MTLNEWAEICLDIYKPNHKQGSHYYYTYRNRLKNCILSYMGEMDIGDIKPIDCQRCINHQNGNSAYQIGQTKQMLNFLFERAIDNDYITKNPARNITKPSGTKGERRSLTNDERAAFLEAIEDPVNLPFAFMYYCGLRPSEACNILASDLIEVAGVPALNIRGTKTKNATRLVPLPSNLSRLIQKSLKSSNKASQEVCVMSYETLSRRWQNLRKKIHAAPDLVPYCLRHTYCTDLLKNGIDVRIAQKLMGHSSINITSTIYSHIDEDLFTITAEKLTDRVAHYECEG